MILATEDNTATLYYEAHVTIDPVFDDLRDVAEFYALKNRFNLAKLIMVKSMPGIDKLSQKDTFMTARGTNLHEISHRTIALVNDLKAAGFRIRRYKIEDTIIDSREKDELELLK